MNTPQKRDLSQLSLRYLSESKFLMLRNLCLGGSATCLLVILTIAQGQLHSGPIDLSVGTAAVGTPIWFCLAGALESYILIGPRSYTHYRNKGFLFFGLMFLIAGLASLVSIGSLIFHLNPDCVWLFFSSVALSGIAVAAFSHGIEKYVTEHSLSSKDD